jgi:asparagine synthase (glutamine-hydrolysing)
MCGIFSLLNVNSQFSLYDIENEFNRGKGRGPEHSSLSKIGIKIHFGFHRLAINGLNDESNQPITYKEISLICNGEIYNYRALYEMMPDVTPETDSDCEVIIHLYRKYGIEYTLQILDGVFSFILLDTNIYEKHSKLFVARDPYGVRPLYILRPLYPITYEYDQLYGFASELKMLNWFCQSKNMESSDSVMMDEKQYTIEPFQPGTYSLYTLSSKVHSEWRFKVSVPYHTMAFSMIQPCPVIDDKRLIDIYLNIQTHLVAAVEKRCQCTERPIACLLSGGLDSSIITALVVDYHRKRGFNGMIETYSIGLADSEDLKYAKMVAEYLGTNHCEIVVSEEDFMNAIPEVIYAIESYDTTTVRASIGNYLIGKYIREHSEAKVIFNGDGADELMGGYLYMNLAENEMEFDRECRRLLRDIHLYDVLRSDKCISTHGLEPRTPYLDRGFVQYYLSIPASVRFHGMKGEMEKYLVRNAFSWYMFKSWDAKPLLPEKILFRKKEAFSDGVSGRKRSLYEILGELCEKKMEEIMTDEIREVLEGIEWNVPKTAEQMYYRILYEEGYRDMGEIVPYFWMPKYIEGGAKDASARTLEMYGNVGV